MSVAENYKVLDEIQHVRQRTGMYAGSVELTKNTEWVYDTEKKTMVKREIEYIPALIKVISEILDNAVDEHKRAPTVLNSIKVSFTDKNIVVDDNGRGIPVEIHPQTQKFVAETIFTNLRAGSNFDDAQDQSLIGTNGLGATLTAILSTEFTIASCDGKKCFAQVIKNGLRDVGAPKIINSKKNGTAISFTPDFEFFKIPNLTIDHKLKIVKRVVDLAACYPLIDFQINGELVNVKSFTDYVKLFSGEYVVDVTDTWQVGISSSDGFDHISFVNGVETYSGGTHIDYVASQIVDGIRAHVKKKNKIDVKPSDIKSHMRLYISASINRPKFSSQTKENMVSLPSSYKSSWVLPEKMLKAILKTTIVQKVLDWAQAKADAEEAAELRKKSKEITKAKPKAIDKFDDAIERIDRKRCSLFLTEGLSAKNSIISARGKDKTIGCYALKGKNLNVYDAKMSDVIDNKEIMDILTITGLIFGEKVISTMSLRFGKIVILSDNDLDGSHCCSLLISFFAKFWPELFKLGAIYRMVTPLYMVKESRGSKEHEFFTVEEYEDWNRKGIKHTSKYFKGLGTFKTESFEKFLTNIDKYLIKINPLDDEDLKKLALAFSEGQEDNRKVWLEDFSYFNKGE